MSRPELDPTRASLAGDGEGRPAPTCGAERRGRRCAKGFPSHGKGCGESRSDSPHRPEGVAPRIRGMQGAGVLSYRVGATRGACPSGRFPFGADNAGVWRREAPGEGVWGGVSPPHRKGCGESRSDSPHRPEGLAPRIRGMQGAGVLSYRVGATRGACPSGRFPFGADNAGVWRREAPGEGVWGGVSPPHRKGCGESRSDSPHRPEGLAPRIRGMQGAGVLSYRVGATRGACPSGRFGADDSPHPSPRG